MITTIRNDCWIKIFKVEACYFNLRERIFRRGYVSRGFRKENTASVHFTSFFLTYKNHDKDSKEGLLG